MPSTSAKQARTIAKLLKHSIVVDDCLVWQGAVDAHGYGAIKFEGTVYKVHRLGFYCHTGREPTLFVLHSCDNKLCWAEKHIFEGTQQDNVDDMIAKGRDCLVNPMIGSDNGQAILNEDKVRDIKVRIRLGETQADIARSYSVDITTVNKIHRGRSWRHVQEISDAI